MVMAKFYRFEHVSDRVYFKADADDVYSCVANGGDEPHWLHVAPNIRPNLSHYEFIMEGTDEEFKSSIQAEKDGTEG